MRCPRDEHHTAFSGKRHGTYEIHVDLDASFNEANERIGPFLEAVSSPRDHDVACQTCGATVWQSRSITFTPAEGSVLLCHFLGFRAPEMCKTRPVVVISPRSRNRQTCIVVPLSTVPSNDHKALVVELSDIDHAYLEKTSWAKCGMATTVSLGRLHVLRDPITGRSVDSRTTIVGADVLKAIRAGAAMAIGLA